ncbi:PH domain-containing protein [Anoxybacillus sp. MB8]|uniref:PH domain-containing protein n=1 Tax=Anoxybacillus sp. MB8 TaxID=2496850 RepID=UPI0013D37C84|nr:PH domain-containing protein [Anoxybacillus sp. MB8]
MEKALSKRAVLMWRMYEVIRLIIFLLLYVIVHFFVPVWVVLGLVCLWIADAILFVFFVPRWKWERWRYMIRDREIELEHGVWIRKRTLIPIPRIQHVDVKQGPLARRKKLASLYIYTAATVHEIPFLDEQEAEKLRYYISSLVKEDENDA